MKRKGLLETEAYLKGLSRVSNKPLQPIKLCGFNAKISRFQVSGFGKKELPASNINRQKLAVVRDL
jgi:hypothetical protein